jgi:sugar O-acyltransferase (sialic acid O-acetyltransferase NeuD family)
VNREDLTVLRVERLNANEDEVSLVRWAVGKGEAVSRDQLIAEIETSKALCEVRAPREGYLFFTAREGEILPVGAVLAVIAPNTDFSLEQVEEPKVPVGPEASPGEVSQTKNTPRFSKAARQALSVHHIDPAEFAGVKLVTRARVEEQVRRRTSGVTGESHGERWRWSESSQRVVILGAGRHAKVCIDTLRRMATFEIAGLATSDHEIGDQVLGVPVLAHDSELEELYRRGYRFFVNGVGAATRHRLRWDVYLRLKSAGFYLPNLVHPSAVVEPSAILGEGNHILANAMVGSGSHIANNCIINSGAVVSHDAVLHDNVHVAPGALLAGGVMVGHDTLIGMGAKIYMDVRIGSCVTIHSGCVVNHDIPDGTVLKFRLP